MPKNRKRSDDAIRRLTIQAKAAVQGGLKALDDRLETLEAERKQLEKRLMIVAGDIARIKQRRITAVSQALESLGIDIGEATQAPGIRAGSVASMVLAALANGQKSKQDLVRLTGATPEAVGVALSYLKKKVEDHKGPGVMQVSHGVWAFAPDLKVIMGADRPVLGDQSDTPDAPPTAVGEK